MTYHKRYARWFFFTVVVTALLAVRAVAQQTVWPWNQNRALLDPNWHCIDPKVVGRAASCFPLKVGNNPWTVTKKYAHYNKASLWTFDGRYNPPVDRNRVPPKIETELVELHVLFEFFDGNSLFVKVVPLPWDAETTGCSVVSDYCAPGGWAMNLDHGKADPRVLLSVGRDKAAYYMPPLAARWGDWYAQASLNGYDGRDRHFMCQGEFSKDFWVSREGIFYGQQDPDSNFTTFVGAGPDTFNNSMGIPLTDLPVAIRKLRQCFANPNHRHSFAELSFNDDGIDESIDCELFPEVTD